MWDIILGGIGIILLLGAVTGTIMEKSIRPGFFVSLILAALVAIVTLIMVKIWNKMQTNTISNE